MSDQIAAPAKKKPRYDRRRRTHRDFLKWRRLLREEIAGDRPLRPTEYIGIDALVIQYLGMVDQAKLIFSNPDMPPAELAAARDELTARSSQLRMQLAPFLPEPSTVGGGEVTVAELERARQRAVAGAEADRARREAAPDPEPTPGPALLLPAPDQKQ